MSLVSNLKTAIVLTMCIALFSCKGRDPVESPELTQAEIEVIRETMEDSKSGRAFQELCKQLAEKRKEYAQSTEKAWNSQATKRRLKTLFKFEIIGDCAEQLVIFNQSDPQEFAEWNYAFLSDLRQRGFKRVIAASGPRFTKWTAVDLSTLSNPGE